MILRFTRQLIILMAVALATSVEAQDIHFTQFRMAPVSVNPAFTGAFKGTYRLSGIYRDQWSPVQNSRPYKTPFASAELNLKAGLLLDYDWIAAGISFVSDRSGSLNFKHQLTALNVAYHLGFDKDYTNVFTLGLSYGSGSRGFDQRGLETPNSLINNTPGINFSENPQKSFSDMSLGVAFRTQTESGALMRFGLTAAHINTPNISLTNALRDTSSIGNPNPNPIDRNAGDNLGMRMTFVAEGSYLAGKNMRINPALLYQNRAGFNELAVQATADYLLNPKSMMVVTGGLGYRLGDAVELIGGIQIKDLKIGLSYDVTTSNLTNAGGGAFELAVGYLGRIFKDPDVKPVIFCPRL